MAVCWKNYPTVAPANSLSRDFHRLKFAKPATRLSKMTQMRTDPNQRVRDHLMNQSLWIRMTFRRAQCTLTHLYGNGSGGHGCWQVCLQSWVNKVWLYARSAISNYIISNHTKSVSNANGLFRTIMEQLRLEACKPSKTFCEQIESA